MYTQANLNASMSGASSATTSLSRAPAAPYDAELRSLVGRLRAATFAGIETDVANLEEAVYDKLNTGQEVRDLNLHYLRPETAIKKLRARILEHLVRNKGKWLRVIVGGEMMLTDDERYVRDTIQQVLAANKYTFDLKHQIDPSHCGCIHVAWRKGKIPAAQRQRENGTYKPNKRSKSYNKVNRSDVDVMGEQYDQLSLDDTNSSGYDSMEIQPPVSVAAVRRQRRGRKAAVNRSIEDLDSRPKWRLNDRELRQNLWIKVMKLELHEKYCDYDNKIRQVTVRKPGTYNSNRVAVNNGGRKPRLRPAPRRTVLLTGMTGSGKTTLVNAAVHYLFGIDYDDITRLAVVTHKDEGSKSQAHSQTEWLTAYTIRVPDEERLYEFDVTFIDTPGLGDTAGEANDNQAVARLKEAFKSGKLGVDEMHAVALVVPASQLRLNKYHDYVTNTICDIFGKNVGKLKIIATFCDSPSATTNRIMSALDLARVPYDRADMYAFNNSVLYTNVDFDNVDDVRRIWENNNEQFERLFASLRAATGAQLELSADVVTARQQENANLNELLMEIRKFFERSDELHQLKTKLPGLIKSVNESKDYMIDIDAYDVEPIPSENGKHWVMSCKRCQTICHFPCTITPTEATKKCKAFDSTTHLCTECINHCGAVYHEQKRVDMKVRKIRKRFTIDDMKKRHKLSTKSSDSVRTQIAEIDTELESIRSNTMELIGNMVMRQQKLDEIALRPANRSTVEYIDLVIDGEINDQQPGYEKRVDYLETLREHAFKMQNGSPRRRPRPVSPSYDGIVNPPWR